MNIDNAVLVRAYKNYIPMNKRLNPSCDEMYLKYQSTSDYKSEIKEYVLKEYEKNTGKHLDTWNDNDYQKLEELVLPFLPLSSVYVSTLSFSINGLVHDDMNNFFSEYNVCVIEPLKYHTNDNFVNFTVNDTTIKGSIDLSDHAILLIHKDTYDKLSDTQKKLLNSNYNLEIFNSSLTDTVSNTLKKYGYPSLNLVNSVAKNYIAESENKESAINFINDFAEKNGLSTLRLFDIYTSPFLTEDKDLEAQKKVNDERKLISEIILYYRNKFYDYLLSIAKENGYKMDESKEYYLMSEFRNSQEVLSELVEYLVSTLGLEKLKNIIAIYNQDLIKNYKTNSQIIEELQKKTNER